MEPDVGWIDHVELALRVVHPDARDFIVIVIEHVINRDRQSKSKFM
jgi:hypothetical protein